MKPVVSILIPTFRRPTMLGEAAQSAVLQDYEGEVEVVVIADGQEGIVPEEVANEPRVRVVRIKHGGQAAAINAGFQASRGAYITRCDDDDHVEPWKVRVLADALEANPEAGGAYALGRFMDASRQPMRLEEERRKVEFLRRTPVLSWATIEEGRGAPIHVAATMWRREVWERSGGWDPTVPPIEDWEHFLHMLKDGARVVAVDAVTDVYRFHPGQRTDHRWKLTGEIPASRRVVRERYPVTVAPAAR